MLYWKKRRQRKNAVADVLVVVVVVVGVVVERGVVVAEVVVVVVVVVVRNVAGPQQFNCPDVCNLICCYCYPHCAHCCLDDCAVAYYNSRTTTVDDDSHSLARNCYTT